MLHFFCEHVLHTPVCKVKTKTQKKTTKKNSEKDIAKNPTQSLERDSLSYFLIDVQTNRSIIKMQLYET